MVLIVRVLYPSQVCQTISGLSLPQSYMYRAHCSAPRCDLTHHKRRQLPGVVWSLFWRVFLSFQKEFCAKLI